MNVTKRDLWTVMCSRYMRCAISQHVLVKVSLFVHTSGNGHIYHILYYFLFSLDDNCSCVCSNSYIGSGQNCSFDSDGDGYPDHRVFCDFNTSYCMDNCSSTCNPLQEDCDGDGYPDHRILSDIINMYCQDNCRYTCNPFQEDCDDDGIGDVCTSYLDFDSNIVTLINKSIVIVIEPGTSRFSLNLTFPHNSTHTVSVQSCEVGWIECEQFSNFSFSGSEEIELYLESEWNLNYLLLSIYQHYGIDSRNRSVRLLVISQNLSVPEFQSRSFVSGDRVWVGVSVSSCTSECPDLNSSLWSVGLRDVNISDMTDYFSLELEYCVFLPSVHWFGFSSYVYSITVKNPTDLLNGRYKLIVSDGISSAEALFTLFYEGLPPPACADELSLGLYWNWTNVSSTQTIACSQLMGEYGDVDNSNLTISRSCETNLQFSSLSVECSFNGDGDQVSLSYTVNICILILLCNQ